jgi:hypothetical protein
MEGYRQRACQFHQGFRPLYVDAGVLVQYPEHNAIHTELLRRMDIVAHNLKFMIRVTKLAGSGTNQNMYGSANVAANGLHQSRAGSDSPR